jgi:hypothetical protein
MWEDNIKTNRREIRPSDTDWINLAKDRDQWMALANTIMNPWFYKLNYSRN